MEDFSDITSSYSSKIIKIITSPSHLKLLSQKCCTNTIHRT